MPPKVVLVVDDHEDSRMICSLVLAHNGYTVLHAANGRDALDTIHREQPDAVLLDISLPVLDGWQVIQMLRRDGHPDLPVVALTALALPEDRARATEMGFDAYLSKPCSPRLIVEEVRRLIGPP